MTPEELKAIRKQHNLNITQFARILGYSPNYVMCLERGKDNIPQRLEKIIFLTFSKKKVRKSSKRS